MRQVIHINDAMSKKLADNGFLQEALSDQLYAWLLTFNGGVELHINDLWKVALVQLSGLPEENYDYNNYYSAWLTSLGYQGAFSDQLFLFWNDVAPIPTPNPQPQGTVGIAIDPNSASPQFYGFAIPQPPSAATPWGSISSPSAYGTEIVGMNAALDNGDTESNIIIRFAANLPTLNEPVTFTWGTQSTVVNVGSNLMSAVINDPTFAQYIKDNEGNILNWFLAETI